MTLCSEPWSVKCTESTLPHVDTRSKNKVLLGYKYLNGLTSNILCVITNCENQNYNGVKARINFLLNLISPIAVVQLTSNFLNSLNFHLSSFLFMKHTGLTEVLMVVVTTSTSIKTVFTKITNKGTYFLLLLLCSYNPLTLPIFK